MTRIKYFITSVLGITCTAVGIWLRLTARDLAWPTQWEYTGPREDTIWAIREHAYQDLSLGSRIWFAHHYPSASQLALGANC